MDEDAEFEQTDDTDRYKTYYELKDLIEKIHDSVEFFYSLKDDTEYEHTFISDIEVISPLTNNYTVPQAIF